MAEHHTKVYSGLKRGQKVTFSVEEPAVADPHESCCALESHEPSVAATTQRKLSSRAATALGAAILDGLVAPPQG